MFNKVNGLKYAPIFVAVFLAACGGGGGSDSGGGSTSQMNNDVNLSGIVEVEAGKNLLLESRVSVLRGSVTSQVWSVAQIDGAESGTNSPKVIDGSCATATRKPGAPATGSSVGVTGTAFCSTSLLIPSTAKPGEWVIKNTAVAVDGNSATDSFTLKIKAKAPSTNGFSLMIPNVPQIQELNKLTQLSASYSVNAGVKVDSVKYAWTQISGETLTLAAANTATPSFIAKSAGEFVFRVVATLTVDGKEETQEGDIVVSVAVAAPVTYFEVEAGDVQVGQVGVPVSLVGKTTGTAPAGSLTYEWTQVSGPQQVIFANEKTLNASFIPQSSGTYVFQVKVSNATGFKTATTTVGVKAAENTEPFFLVSAGNAQLADTNTVVNLKGEVLAGTPPPKNVSYLWEQTAGSPVTLASATSLQASFVSVAAGSYEFKLTATSEGVSKSSMTSVTVKAPEVLVPFFMISAGNAQLADTNTVVNLKGEMLAGTPAPKNVTYLWEQVSGDSVTLSNPTSLQSSFITPNAGNYGFKLTATADGVSKSSVTTVNVKAEASTTPFFIVSAGDAQLVDPDTIVTLKGQVASGTPAPTNVTYLWEQISGASVALSNATSLQATFMSPASGNFEFRLTVSSNGVAKNATTVVFVTPPVVTPPVVTPPIVVGPDDGGFVVGPN